MATTIESAGPNNKTIVSFMIGNPELKAARKASLARDIPFSMWLREAAREKLRREAKRKAA